MSNWKSEWGIPRVEATQDPRTYEKACLDAVRHAIDTPGHRKIQRVSGRRLEDIRLEGSFPDTRVHLTLKYGPQRGGQRELAFRIWDFPEGHGLPPDGQSVPTPAVFGIDVVGWALES